ncbi:MAG: methyltransferase domain-containing protein [Candidatus Sumerlaeia bacterium]|nr:methyltransferase domain-containing protein [Candidatus Sumerlaeia bacterium]
MMDAVGKRERSPDGSNRAAARVDLLFDNLPADAAVRFAVVAGLVRARASRFVERPTLLDVGGHPCTFARTFSAAYPRWKAVTVDTVDERMDGYTVGSALELPFGDDSFDVVTTIDVLEHIPPKHRPLFLSELCRVCRSTVIIAAPFHHEATAQLESLLNTAHENIFGDAHPWLGEHVEHGLPKLREIFEAMPGSHGIVEAVENYDLGKWFTWQLLDLARKARGELDSQWDAFDQAQLDGVMRGTVDVAYRTVLVAEKGEPNRVRHGEIKAPQEAADDLVAAAGMLTKLVTLSAVANDTPGSDRESQAINERLKEALVAAEMEIARLQKRGGGLLDRLVQKLRQAGRNRR